MTQIVGQPCEFQVSKKSRGRWACARPSARNGWRLRPLRTLAGLRGHCFGLVAALPTALVALAEGGADDASGGPEGDDGALHVWDFGAAYYYGSRDGGRRRRVPAPRDAVCGETTAREHRAVPAEPAGVPLS